MRRKRPPVLEALESRLCLDSGAVPPMYPGPPIVLPGGAWTQTPYYGSPIFADLNGDGKNELIVEAAGGRMIAYQAGAGGALIKFQEYDAGLNAKGQQANFKSTPVVVTMPNGRKAIVAGM